MQNYKKIRLICKFHLIAHSDHNFDKVPRLLRPADFHPTFTLHFFSTIFNRQRIIRPLEASSQHSLRCHVVVVVCLKRAGISATSLPRMILSARVAAAEYQFGARTALNTNIPHNAPALSSFIPFPLPI